jgi:nitrate reductase beta subunit
MTLLTNIQAKLITQEDALYLAYLERLSCVCAVPVCVSTSVSMGVLLYKFLP